MNELIRRIAPVLLTGILVLSVTACDKADKTAAVARSAPGDEIHQTGVALKSFAERSSPAFRNQRLKVFGNIEGGGLSEVCACIKVCNSQGQNCTACSCSPASCGTCD